MRPPAIHQPVAAVALHPAIHQPVAAVALHPAIHQLEAAVALPPAIHRPEAAVVNRQLIVIHRPVAAVGEAADSDPPTGAAAELRLSLSFELVVLKLLGKLLRTYPGVLI
jgi:hypothetical protein